MAWPAPSPGSVLEAEGNFRPREMTVPDGIRLMTCLGVLSSSVAPSCAYTGTSKGGVYASARRTRCHRAAHRRVRWGSRRSVTDRPDRAHDRFDVQHDHEDEHHREA